MPDRGAFDVPGTLVDYPLICRCALKRLRYITRRSSRTITTTRSTPTALVGP